jgi:hypothetical protein
VRFQELCTKRKTINQHESLHPLQIESFEERSILLKFKEVDNFNQRKTLSISRIYSGSQNNIPIGDH